MGSMTEDTERKYVGVEHLSITLGIPGGDVDDDGITKEMVEEMQRIFHQNVADKLRNRLCPISLKNPVK